MDVYKDGSQNMMGKEIPEVKMGKTDKEKG